jgi:hypothetical protein
MRRCDTHVHGSYVTFPQSGQVYHRVEADMEHTLCHLLLMHPYDGKAGTIIDTYEGGCPFPTFHVVPPQGRRLCFHCHMKERTP